MSAHLPRPQESPARKAKIPELSCEACAERKVRCDKGNPCSTCQATGVVCVPTQRKRLPRGRHVRENRVNKENTELRERLARLESLIATDHSSSEGSSSTHPLHPATSAPSGVPFGSGPRSDPSSSAVSHLSHPHPHPSPVPSGVTSLASAAAAATATTPSSYPSILSNPPPSTSSSPSSAYPASLTRTEATKRPASSPPRYLANAFWHDLVDNVCTPIALLPVPCTWCLCASTHLLQRLLRRNPTSPNTVHISLPVLFSRVGNLRC